MYLDGSLGLDTVVLETGDLAIPSESVVYVAALEDPLIQIQLTIETVGAYALLVEHGSDEMLVVVTSSIGAVLEAGAEEGVDEDDEEDDDDDDSSAATGEQWMNALVASVVVSLCRCVWGVVYCYIVCSWKMIIVSLENTENASS